MSSAFTQSMKQGASSFQAVRVSLSLETEAVMSLIHLVEEEEGDLPQGCATGP